jgi:uncharacterized membrane protein YhaH (DUF805 family)
MTFAGAVRGVLRQYAVFGGRAPRSEFWWWYLFTVLINGVATAIDRLTDATLGFGFLGTVVSLGLLVPTLAVSVRRLHDSNLSGWWLLAPIGTALVGTGAIFGGAIALIASAFSNAGPGSGITGLAVALFVAGGLTLLASLIINVVLMLRPSSAGPNRFGPWAGTPDQHPPAGAHGNGPWHGSAAWDAGSSTAGTAAPPR